MWLSTALGLAAKTVETASNTPMVLTLLPFLGSGFVPTATMPSGLRQFAEYQPFTPVTEAVRRLLNGTGAGINVIAAIAWHSDPHGLGTLMIRAGEDYLFATKRVVRRQSGPSSQTVARDRPTLWFAFATRTG